MSFEPVDRVPNVEIGYWDETLTRWREEGLPADIPLRPEPGDLRYSRNSRELTVHFGLDAHNISYAVSIKASPIPPHTYEVIAEDSETRTVRRGDGHVVRCLRSNEGIFQDLDWAVKSTSDWERVSRAIQPGWHNVSHSSPDKLPPNDRDYPVVLAMPGFFWQMRDWMGFERACTIFHLDPAWAKDILEFWGDYLLAQSKLVLEHLDVDYVQLDEDMCYNGGPMISPRLVEEFLVPQYNKLTDFYRTKSIVVTGIDTDGLPDELIPVLHQGRIDMMGPFEKICRRGKDDLLTLAHKHPWLRMIGGVDKTALCGDVAAIDAEVARIRPLVERGGYIPTVDHKVPPETSLANYKHYLERKAHILRRNNSSL